MRGGGGGPVQVLTGAHSAHPQGPPSAALPRTALRSGVPRANGSSHVQANPVCRSPSSLKKKSCRLKRLIGALFGCKLDRGADLRLPGSARRGSLALAYRDAFASLASASNSRRRGHLAGPALDRADRFDQHLRAAITISESGPRPVKGSVADWCRVTSRIFPRGNSGENEGKIWIYHATHGVRPRAPRA